MELNHLQIASELFKKYEKRDPEEVIGTEIIIPCRFLSQKDYVQKVLEKEVNKRLAPDGEFYKTINEIPEDWASYPIQERVAEISAPSENAIRIGGIYHDRDIVEAKEALQGKQAVILEKGLQKRAIAWNTVMPDELEEMIKKHESRKEDKEKLI